MKLKILILCAGIYILTAQMYGFEKIKPYLQLVSADTMCLIVDSDNKETINVKYWSQNGTEFNKKTAFYKLLEFRREKHYFHRIFLTGLTPSKEYQYLIAENGKPSVEGKFKTSPDTSEILRFAVVADTQSNPDIHSLISKKIKKLNPNFVIYAGDLTENGSFPNWKNEFFTPDAISLFSSVPFAPVIGNHDDFSKDYKAVLQFPRNGDNESFGSFDIGKAHFLMLNTQKKFKKGSPQYKFAEQDLKNCKSKWKFVVQHIPVHSPRKMDYDKNLQILADSLYVPLKVDFVISGHVHFYQRNFFEGIVHMIIGGGGGNLVKEKELKESVVTKSEFHFAMFEVDQNFVFVKVYNVKGELIDSFEVLQHY